MDQKREERKHEHIQYAISLERGPLSPGWEDVHLIHQAVLNNDLAKIETGTCLFKKELQMPLIINALTGGASGLEEINRDLAFIAKELGIGMAVGSQTAGIRNQKLRKTYEIVRKTNPHGLILANVSALVESCFALEAVEMIEADALQLHLNGLQELIMVEGDRNFAHLKENIVKIVEKVPVPVIIKEVGNGISREAAEELKDLGIKAIDVSGSGGTNFASIELARRKKNNLDFLRFWGIPTAISLLEVKDVASPLKIIASGGILNSSDMVKALALGADAVGVAGLFLEILKKEGKVALKNRIKEMKEELRIVMLLLGISSVQEFKNIPLVITGFTQNWCEQRRIKMK